MERKAKQTPDYGKVLDMLPPLPEPKVYTPEQQAARAELVPVLRVDFSDLPHSGSMILENPNDLLIDVRNGMIGDFLDTIWDDTPLDYEGYTITIKIDKLTRGELDDMGEWEP